MGAPVLLLTLEGVLIGLGILLFDLTLYSPGLAVMRAYMSTRKWPAIILAFTPSLLLSMWRSVEELLPPVLASRFGSEWIIFVGWPFCIALAVSWLGLPNYDVEREVPYGRDFITNWALGLGLLIVDYFLKALITQGWDLF